MPMATDNNVIPYRYYIVFVINSYSLNTMETTFATGLTLVQYSSSHTNHQELVGRSALILQTQQLGCCYF